MSLESGGDKNGSMCDRQDWTSPNTPTATMATTHSNITATVEAVIVPTPRTDEEKMALREKHRANLALLEAKRTGILHITKIRQPVFAATLFNWVKDGKLIVAPWNREEVVGREGTANEWMESLATKISPGQFIAYYHGKVGKDKKVTPTKEHPVVVYEGGHRTRWTQAVFENRATYCGMTYSELKELEPDTAKAIEEAIVNMELAVSEREEQLMVFAKNEYHKVNTKGETLKAGEVIRAGGDTTRATLEDRLENALQRDLKPKKRDSHLEDLRALVHGAAGLVDRMDKKKGSLTNVDPLTEAESARAREVIDQVAQVEQEIVNLPELSGAKIQKRLRSRILDLKVDGTLVWALHDAPPAVRDMIRRDWVEYHRRFFGDATLWKEKLASLKTSTVERSRYKAGETPYPVRWQRIQTALYPAQAVVVDEENLSVEPM